MELLLEFNTGVNNFFTIKILSVSAMFTSQRILIQPQKLLQRISIPAKEYQCRLKCQFMRKNMRKMRQRAKYAVIAYSHKTDMPSRLASHLGLRSQLDLAPKRLESRLSHHLSHDST